MKQIVTGYQMKNLDRDTIEKKGVPSMVLMERAALAVVEELQCNFNLNKTLVVCGSGNNGADGIAVARLLHLSGKKVDLYFAGSKEHFTKEAKLQYDIACNYEVSEVKILRCEEYTTIVDAIFGIGLSRKIEGVYQDLIYQINSSEVPVAAVDIPSGVQSTTGEVMGIAIRATQTVTFGYGKSGLYLFPGAMYSGRVTISDVGIYGECREGLLALEEEDLKLLPKRRIDGNKGTFGKVLVVAGSHNMAGAAFFSAKAALLSGAGMVRIFTEESNRLILQQLLPEALLSTYDISEEENRIKEKLQEAENWADVVVAGPGLSTKKDAQAIIETLLCDKSEKPLILDADGLNILSKHIEWYDNMKRFCIFTPHVGEMARLSKCSVLKIKEHPLECIMEYTKEHPQVVVMKDARTIIKTQKACYINLTGNDGMATAGSGDVLAGLLGGLLAQGTEQEFTAPLGVWIHGSAGDLAAEKVGRRSVTAKDILEQIPEILKKGDKRR